MTRSSDRIIWDRDAGQLLSAVCQNCPEPHFQRRTPQLPHIGCCAYEPVFTLFEIYKMIEDGQTDFFLNQVYSHPDNTVCEYEIIVGARIDPLFYEKQPGEKEAPFERYERLLQSPRTIYQATDERLAYAVCQFFENGRGCGLQPKFKTGICRSFICTSIEEVLSDTERKQLADWQRVIREEADPFHRRQQAELERRGWTLPDHVEQIIDHFTALSARKKAGSHQV